MVSSVTYITVSPSRDREGDRLLGQPEQLIERPALRVLPQRARSDERAALDRHAGALRDLGDRRDVGHQRAGGAVGLDGEPRDGDLACQPLDVPDHLRSGAGQADVRRIDAQPIDQVKDLELLLDGRDCARTATAGRRAASRR